MASSQGRWIEPEGRNERIKLRVRLFPVRGGHGAGLVDLPGAVYPLPKERRPVPVCDLPMPVHEPDQERDIPSPLALP